MEYVYIISDGIYYKIGRSIDPHQRLQQLQTATYRELSIEHLYNVDDVDGWESASELESWFHNKLNDYHIRGEWFNLRHSHADLHILEDETVKLKEKLAKFKEEAVKLLNMFDADLISEEELWLAMDKCMQDTGLSDDTETVKNPAGNPRV